MWFVGECWCVWFVGECWCVWFVAHLFHVTTCTRMSSLEYMPYMYMYFKLQIESDRQR